MNGRRAQEDEEFSVAPRVQGGRPRVLSWSCARVLFTPSPALRCPGRAGLTARSPASITCWAYMHRGEEAAKLVSRGANVDDQLTRGDPCARAVWIADVVRARPDGGRVSCGITVHGICRRAQQPQSWPSPRRTRAIAAGSAAAAWRVRSLAVRAAISNHADASEHT